MRHAAAENRRAHMGRGGFRFWRVFRNCGRSAFILRRQLAEIRAAAVLL